MRLLGYSSVESNRAEIVGFSIALWRNGGGHFGWQTTVECVLCIVRQTLCTGWWSNTKTHRRSLAIGTERLRKMGPNLRITAGHSQNSYRYRFDHFQLFTYSLCSGMIYSLTRICFVSNWFCWISVETVLFLLCDNEPLHIAVAIANGKTSKANIHSSRAQSMEFNCGRHRKARLSIRCSTAKILCRFGCQMDSTISTGVFITNSPNVS